MIIENLTIKFKEIYNGTNIEESLLALKNAGASQLECLRVIKNELGLSMNEADQIILNSRTWEKEKEGTIQFRNKIFDLFDSTCKTRKN